MWERTVEQVRGLGPRKVLLILVATAAAIAFAYGNHTSDNAVNSLSKPSAGKSTLAKPATTKHP